MANIGLSTGCLHKAGTPIEERIRIYHSIGADAIEMSFATPSELLGFRLSDETKSDILKYSTVTIHAPWKKVRYNAKSAGEVIEKLKNLNESLPINGMVIHPDTIDSFSYMENTGLPFMLENMDKRKSFGIHPDHFQALNNDYAFGYVLDLQHIYEHDPTMELAMEFIDLWGDRLNHMHVSGCLPDKLHVPTHLSDNKEEIVKILEFGLNVPKILEGMRESSEDMAAEELDFIRQYET